MCGPLLTEERKAFSANNGDLIEFYNYGRKLFRGVVFSVTTDSNGSQQIVAYDENIYLLKSTDSRVFKNVKASDIVNRLCSDFGITPGSIEDTGYVIPKLILSQKSIFEMIRYALEVTRKQTGKRYLVRNVRGTLWLTKFTSEKSD